MPAAAPPAARPAAVKAPVIPPRERIQQPPVAKQVYKAPPPALDAPWLDDQDSDPTEIGSIFGMPRAHSDTPIDADSTERIPPERLQRLQQNLPRGAHEHAQHAPSERLTTDRFDLQHEKVSDDEAPTTLFDRSVLKSKLNKKPKSGQNPPARTALTTERAPAPAASPGPTPVAERASPPLKPPPLPRLRGPRDS